MALYWFKKKWATNPSWKACWIIGQAVNRKNWAGAVSSNIRFQRHMIIDREHHERQPVGVLGRIGQGTMQIMMGRMVLFAAGYFVAMLLARRLGPADYGAYGIILSVVLW